ncbi:MAG: hypothetical protein EXS38_09195 [Opitutus sp.]|nr:hypothetical protein [Opitutus sp.]
MPAPCVPISGRALRRFILVVGLTLLPSAAHAERQLFLDPGLIHHLEGAHLTVNPPQSSQVVLRPDRPWEQALISFYTTVIDENGKLRLWYICRDIDNRPNLAYAESKDGVTWIKPELGIVDYHGSKRNNLVGVTSLDGAVYRDPHARSGEEYVFVGSAPTEGVYRFYSPDGLHWQRDARALLPFRSDTQNVVFWDELSHGYALYLRGWNLAGRWEDRLRKVVRLDAKNLAEPLPIRPSGRGNNPGNANDRPRIVDEVPTVLEADARDPIGTDVYNLSVEPYPLDPRWYVGFPSLMLREKHISDGRLEVYFVGSRDGRNWQRYDRAAYAKLGLAGAENANMTFIGPGIVVRGDELWQFGTGFRNRHGAVEQRKERADGVVCRYVQRIDGFVSLDFAQAGGRCVMQPVVATGERLRLNLDTGVLGTLRVGLGDAEGHPIPGFSVEECDPIRTNSIRWEASWRGRTSLAALKGRSLRVEFLGSRTKLFSFYFD